MSDKTQSLGEYLRHEREGRGVTIEQLASATKIGVRLLHSLEADHYADLPAKPFIRGFVTSYTRFIGLDPKETLIRFNDFIEHRAHDRPARDAGHSGYAFERKEQSRMMLWVVIGIFVLLGGVGVLVLKPNLKHKHHGSHAEKLQEAYPSPSPSISPSPSGLPSAVPSLEPSPVSSGVAAVSPSPTAEATPEASEAAETEAVAPPAAASTTPVSSASPASAPSPTPSPNLKDPLNSGLNLKSTAIKQKVIFRASAPVLVRYKVDDRAITSLRIGKDKLLVLRAQTQIWIQLGDAEALQYSYNGRAYRSVKVGEGAAQAQGAVTLTFPVQAAETIKEPFPGQPDFPTP